MYITCPSCSTSYEVNGTQIGPQGRVVRCFNCHHSWHQYPVSAPPHVRPASSSESPRYVPQARPAAYAQPGYASAGYEAPMDYAPQPSRPAAAPRAAPKPQPMPEPEPEMEPEPMPPPRAARSTAPPPPPPPPVMEDEDLPSDDELDKMLGPDRGDAASSTFGSGGGGDVEAIDEDEIEKLPDPPPVRQMVVVDDDDFDDDLEPEDIPDPDPIPGTLSGDEDVDDDEEKGSALKALIVPTILIVLIGALVGGAIVGRDYVVKYVPQANDYFFDLLGLHVMIPGEGLERKLTRTAMETVAETDYVVATGLVTNVSDKAQPLPMMTVQLIDANGKVMDTKSIKLDKSSLEAGESLEFKTTFEGSLASARSVRTEWGTFAEASAN